MMANKKNLLAYGLGITLAMTSLPVHAQYYGVDDSVQVDLSVLDGKPVARSLFPSIQLTPPPVAEVDPIAPVPNAVPLFASTDAAPSYKTGKSGDASERTAARAVSATNVWTYHNGMFEKVYMPETQNDTAVISRHSSERILKPSAAADTLPAVHTEEIEYSSNDISLEPVYPAPTAYSKNVFKPGAAPVEPVVQENIAKPVAKPAPLKKAAPVAPAPVATPSPAVSKQISTIDRSINALTSGAK